MSKGTIFYVIGFLLIAIPGMVNRYVVDLPGLLYYMAMIGGFVCIYLGMRAKGEKINWDFDFSPSGSTAQSRRKEQEKAARERNGK